MKIKLIVFIILILILSACKDNTNIQNTKIDLPPEIAQTATSITYISHQKDKIAYIAANNATLAGVYVYTLATKENKLLISLKALNSETDILFDDWSPDDKYIILDTGSYIIREKIVIDSQTGKIIADFGTLEESYTWLSPDEIVFTIPHAITNASRAETYGIAKINISNQEKQILKYATVNEDYILEKILDNKILFRKVIHNYRKSGKYIYNADKESYWIMDKDGKNEKQVEYKNNKWQVIK